MLNSYAHKCPDYVWSCRRAGVFDTPTPSDWSWSPGAMITWGVLKYRWEFALYKEGAEMKNGLLWRVWYLSRQFEKRPKTVSSI